MLELEEELSSLVNISSDEVILKEKIKLKIAETKRELEGLPN